MLRSDELKSSRASQSARSKSAFSSDTLDLVGVGFGPANLALSTVIHESVEEGWGPKVSSLFLERKPGFKWHPGLMLEGARVQLSFMKDLVTLRNPRSCFTFLSYLKEKGRLDYFANLRNFFPTRVEFNDYYTWVAGKLDHYVEYGREVEEIRAVEAGGSVEELAIRYRDVETGASEEVRTRNLVVATGGVPRVPNGIDIRASKRTFHAQDTLFRVPRDFPNKDAPYRFVVVGSGQSAAEVFQFLYERFPNARVTAAIRRFAYKPADDSHFVNEIFFPHMVDFLYGISPEKRQRVLEAHMDTNYSCVDLDLIQEIYEKLYQNRIVGDEKVRIRPFLELRSLVDGDKQTMLHFRDAITDEPVSMEADGVVLATGYERAKTHPLLADLDSYLLHDEDGGYQVERNYRLRTPSNFLSKVYIQGFSERTHGLSDTLLSVLPARSMEIFESLFCSGVSDHRALESAS